MHQLGLLPAALHYYKKGLSLGPAVPSQSTMDNSAQGKSTRDNSTADIFDLKREIAFNIALIYQSSGADDLARMYLHQNIVI